MGKRIDLTGQRFGRLVVIGESNERKSGCKLWKCQCDCGNITLVRTGHLNAGTILGCGCLQREVFLKQKHGHCINDKPSITYKSWEAMKRRCKDLSNKRYGGRGITYCNRWEDFSNFLEDMGERPLNTTIDRINNDGNYEPSNCRWADAKLQRQNQEKGR